MPAAIPAIAASEIGVVHTRSGNLVDRPRVTLNAPPYGSRMSSPSIYTFGLTSMAWCRAWFSASRTVVIAVLATNSCQPPLHPERERARLQGRPTQPLGRTVHECYHAPAPAHGTRAARWDRT